MITQYYMGREDCYFDHTQCHPHVCVIPPFPTHLKTNTYSLNDFWVAKTDPIQTLQCCILKVIGPISCIIHLLAFLCHKIITHHRWNVLAGEQ